MISTSIRSVFSFAFLAQLAAAQSLGCHDLGGVAPIQQQLLAASQLPKFAAVRRAIEVNHFFVQALLMAYSVRFSA